eukprot:SAG31_NODE_4911_length_2872_cov_1.190047_5_plen_105_part_00
MSRRGLEALQTARRKLYRLAVTGSMNWQYLAEHSRADGAALTTFEALSPADGCWYDVRSVRKVATKRANDGSTWAAALDGGTCLASWDGYGSDQDEVIEGGTHR